MPPDSLTPYRDRPLTVPGTGTGSKDQHRVAEGVEAVALGDCQAVELARLLHAGERHHEGEQRRAREVEVRQQGVDSLELEARGHEQRRAAAQRRAARER